MIGVFDSGSGGLTVLSALKKKMPNASVVYFGDIKNAPYGNKTQEELLALTTNSIALLKEKGATKIISACNSVSASVAVSLLDSKIISNQDIVEMVGPTVARFKESNLRIGLCATEATIKSGIYQNGFKSIGKEVNCIAIPELAGAIEFGESDKKIISIIKESISPYLSEIDVLILACTHYPLVISLFKEVVGVEVEIFDPAIAVSERATELFVVDAEGDKSIRFIISQDSEYFLARAKELFADYPITFEVID